MSRFSRISAVQCYIYIYILEWTRALNARSKLATGAVAAAFVGPKRLFVSLWDRVTWLWLSLVVSPLDGSWSLLGRAGQLLGRPGRVLGRSWPFLGDPGRPPGSLVAVSLGRPGGLLSLSWHTPRLLPASLGLSWRPLGPPLGAVWRLLAAKNAFSGNYEKTVVLA